MDQNIEIENYPNPPPTSLLPKGSERFKNFINSFKEIPRDIHLRALMVIGITLSSFLSAPSKSATEIISQPEASSISKAEVKSSENLSINPDFESKIFANFTEEQKAIAEREIEKELVVYSQDTKRLQNTLRWEGTVKSVLDDDRLNLTESEKKLLEKLDLAIIDVESEGNPHADSAQDSDSEEVKKNSAKGLMQVKPTTAQEIADRYRIYQYDLYNGWENIFFGTVHLLEINKKFGLSLGVWNYHLGMGNMNEAIKTYLIQEAEIPIKEVEDLFSDPNYCEKLASYTKRYQLNPVAFLQSPAVTGKLKYLGAFDDQTDRYFYRVMAAIRLILRTKG